MHMDKVTEAIAHFIGLFHLSLEQARARQDYTEFDQRGPAADDPGELDRSIVIFRSPYIFNDPDPGLRHVPEWPPIEKLKAPSDVYFEPPDVDIPWGSPKQLLPRLEPQTGASGDISGSSSPAKKYFESEPPGQVAIKISEENILADNDYVSAGGHGLVYAPVGSPHEALEILLESAYETSPLIALEQPVPTDAIADFIEEATQELIAAVKKMTAGETMGSAGAAKNVAAAGAEGQPQQHDFGLHARVIEGTYVDGEITLAPPKFDDFLPEAIKARSEAENDESQKTKVKGDGKDASVKVEAGSNFLVNEAVIDNKMFAATVFATAGKHVEVNAITQVNVASDVDSIGARLADWSADEAQTAAYNIAEFKRLEMPKDDPAPEDTSFPKAWALTTITGDLLFTNWIKQVSFVADNDIHVLSASGASTVVTTGANTAINAVTINELGLYYDLVLVGGNIYDANFISQMNVLLDNDLAGAVADFQTAGPGKLSTGGNLLWNEAAIVNVGGADRFEALPAQYREAMDKLAAGGKDLSEAVLSDSAFLGLTGLRVLYVTGSIYDLQVVSQTNVLGDADEVALAMDKLLARSDADWTITTGANALVNVAGILDIDAGAKTYVGEGHFSDEFLVQTEIIKVDPLPGGENADKLVSEAVAFLSEDMVSPDDPNGGHETPDPGVHSAHTDVMQSVVS